MRSTALQCEGLHANERMLCDCCFFVADEEQG